MTLTTEEQIPDKFVAMRNVAKLEHGIKVFQCFDEDNHTYFSVTQEPDNVTCAEDIKTRSVYKVGRGETGLQVKKQAIEKAKGIEEMESSIQGTDNGTA